MFQVHVPVMMNVHELNPVAYNPNKMAPEKYEALKETITKDGFIEPVVVQKKGTNIIGGHHRVKAIKELCVESASPVPQIPCIVLDVSDYDAKKINLKLNHVHGEPDARLLGEVLVDLFPTRMPDRFEVDVTSLGLSLDDATKYMNLVDPQPFDSQPEKVNGFGKSVTLSLEFSDVRLRDKVKKIIQERVEVQKKKSGHVVAELLSLPSRSKSTKKVKSAHA